MASLKLKNYDEETNNRKVIFEKLQANHLQHHAATLVSNFGKQCDVILERFEKLPNMDNEIRLIRAQLEYCIDMEMVKTSTDFFVRRIGLLYFDLPLLKKIK